MNRGNDEVASTYHCTVGHAARFRPIRRLAPLLGIVLVTGAPLAAQVGRPVGRVVGTIVDQRTGKGLPSAALAVVGTEIHGPASPDGRFMLPLMNAGTITLEVTHPGYLQRTEVIDVLEGQTVDARITLVEDTVFDLQPLVVTVRSRVLERRGFYDRRRQGYAGTFLAREQIAERGANTFTELLDGLPGVRILPAGIEGARVVFQRGVSMRDSGVCAPALYMDGVRSQIRVYDAIVEPSHVEGMEVYTGANVPGQYNDPCGAILIWTRVR